MSTCASKRHVKLGYFQKAHWPVHFHIATRKSVCIEVGFRLGLCGFMLLFAFDHRHCSLMRQRLPLFSFVWRRFAPTRTPVRAAQRISCARPLQIEQDVYNHISTNASDLSYLQTHGDSAAGRSCVGVPEFGGPLLRLIGPNQRIQNAMPCDASCAMPIAHVQW